MDLSELHYHTNVALYYLLCRECVLSAIKDGALAPQFKCLMYALWSNTCVHCVTRRVVSLLVLMLSKSCAIIMLGLIQCHPEWIRIGILKYLTECYFLCVHMLYHVF